MVESELLPQVTEFRLIGAASAELFWTVVVKKELSRTAKLSIYQSS